MFTVKPQFPVWQYLNQPLFHLAYPLILNPRRYWFHYRVEMLERCLMQCESQGQLD